MNPLVCRQCGAALLPDTNFCRKCGTSISLDSGSVDDDRASTIRYGEDFVATEPFGARHTAPESPVSVTSTKGTTPGPVKLLVIGVVIFFVLAAIFSTVVFVKIRSQQRVVSDESIIYPGSRKTMDIGAGGGRAVSLETTDSFDRVREWYQAKLKPEKVVQLTENSVVMKGNNATATIIGDENKTNVLLKILP